MNVGILLELQASINYYRSHMGSHIEARWKAIWKPLVKPYVKPHGKSYGIGQLFTLCYLEVSHRELVTASEQSYYPLENLP